MRFLKLLPSLFLLASISNNSIDSKRVFVYSASDVYGPYYPNDNDQTISFTIYQKESFVSYETFDIRDKKGNLMESLLPRKKETKDIRLIYSYRIPFSYLFTNEGFQFTFSCFKKENKELYFSKSFSLMPIKSKTISSTQYLKESYFIRDTLFSFSLSKLDYEEFSFKDGVFYFPSQNYNILSLEGIYFTYFCPDKEIDYQDAYLEIVDEDNFFVALEKDENNITKIPVSLSYKNNQITFKYETPFFYEKSQNIISLSPKEGFFLTDYFYLPKNKKQDIEAVKFTLVINQMGRNKTTVKIPTEYFLSDNLFGKCHNSDYCVVGGMYD